MRTRTEPLRGEGSPLQASLYIHVPFCVGSCDYCDFYSIPLNLSHEHTVNTRLNAFIETLLLDGERFFETFRPGKVPTVYIGGGTPSVLGSERILGLLNGINRLISRYAPVPEEITVEANPESADEAFLAAACKSGATRLSMGVQTFYTPSRRAVNRAGYGSDLSGLYERLALAAQYFPGALSLDLISGLPFQNEKILKDDINTALSYKPAHISLYALTLEPGTPLADQSSAQNILPPKDEADRLWICGRDALENSGLHQYEVSNFCLPGKESRHNIRYWRMQNWLAMGPAASGTVINDETGSGFRYTVPPDVDRWIGNREQGTGNREELDSFTLMKEIFLMGFRYIEGPDEELFQRRFRRSSNDCIPKTIYAWRGGGFIQSGKIALTKEGLLFLDSFLTDAFLELDAYVAHDIK